MNPILKHIQNTTEPPKQYKWHHVQGIVEELRLEKLPIKMGHYPLLTVIIEDENDKIILLSKDNPYRTYDPADPKSIQQLQTQINKTIERAP
jgi:hypothetical protein